MPETAITHAREETQQLAADAARRLADLPRERAAVVTLRGELGAGKTTFTQGLLAALGVAEPVTSPTFVLVHRYGLAGAFANAYHVDAYRLAEAGDLDALGLAAPLSDPESLVIVEWPEVGGDLFDPALDVLLEHGGDEHERRVTLDWRA